MREIVVEGERRTGRGEERDIFHEISIRRRRTRTGWRGRSSGGLGGSRTKLLKMDEISDLPASGLPARSS